MNAAADAAGAESPVPVLPRVKATAIRLNLPNLLTLARVAVVPVILLVLAVAPRLPGADGGLWYCTATVLTLVAGITDAFDGHLARARKEVTRFGKFSDPVADKLLTTAVFTLLVEKGAVAGWIVVLMLGREFGVMALRMMLASDGVQVEVSRWAKIKTIFQVVAMVAVLVHLSLIEVGTGGWLPVPVSLERYFAVVAGGSVQVGLVLTLATGYVYFREHWSHLEV
jgi:CDP-diacylglycerol--glycerol-3-phosphate 3-phosphatidyltransferase